MSKKQFIYNVEYEVVNQLLGKKEIHNATFTSDRDVKFIPESEIFERLPTSSVTKIISINELS